MGALVNLAVLAQAVVIAALVLLVPLAAPGRIKVPRAGVLRSVVYFPVLALGFLFIEIYLIEEGQFLAGRPDQRVRAGADRDAGVLGAGQPEITPPLFDARPRQGMALVAAVVLRLVRRGAAVAGAADAGLTGLAVRRSGGGCCCW